MNSDRRGLNQISLNAVERFDLLVEFRPSWKISCIGQSNPEVSEVGEDLLNRPRLADSARTRPLFPMALGQKMKTVEKTVSFHSRRGLGGSRWVGFFGKSIANRLA
jgi:hypothetical protein